MVSRRTWLRTSNLWRVLIADDNPTDRLVLTSYLHRAGYLTLEAMSGRDCIQVVNTSTVDAVLMDVSMPEMDGLEATRQLRAAGCKLPIIGVSVLGSEDDQRAGLAAGMSEYLVKPVTGPMLKAALARRLMT